jgi:hypothetical protein
MLRLSEENGYSTPWSLCLLAGIKQNEIRTTGMSVKKLAEVSNRPQSELELIAYSASPGQPRWARLLGHPLVPTELSITDPKFCPQCVAEMRFIEAHWHLSLMAGCPLHMKASASVCSHCKRGLRWFRPGLLECKCGASLLNSGGPSISRRTASLLGVIRSRVLVADHRPADEMMFPLNDLVSMDLRSLLVIVRTLGQYRLVADGCEPGSDQLQIVDGASEVLSEWPTNFFKMLTALGEKHVATREGGVGKQFDSLYRALFRNKAIGKRHADFLRTAFVEFATNHWGHGFVDPKLAKHVGNDGDRRFMTLTEFAENLGVQPRTATRILKTTEITAERVKCGNASRIIVDTLQDAVSARKPGRILRTRAAARILGLPVATLIALRQSAVFDVKYLPAGFPGWHESDLRAFAAKMLQAADRMPMGHPDTISLQRIMNNRHLSPIIKADLVQRFLTREIRATVESADSSVSGIELDLTQYQEFLKAARSRVFGDTQTPTEAATMLHCDRGSISGLLERGLLSGYRSPQGLRISSESIAQFVGRYISLASHANTLGTSTRALMKRCRANGVELVLVSVRGRTTSQPFIRLADLPSILSNVA